MPTSAVQRNVQCARLDVWADLDAIEIIADLLFHDREDKHDHRHQGHLICSLNDLFS